MHLLVAYSCCFVRLLLVTLSIYYIAFSVSLIIFHDLQFIFQIRDLIRSKADL
jgi:hypothetical protein